MGGSGESVTAVPDSGYYFTSWSDGNSSASRTDGPVQSDLDVVAGFSLYQYTLAYSAGANGSLSGIVGQTVFHGSDGTAVQAIPDDGYHFIQWSDGSTQNPRVDLAVQGDRSVSAAFGINEYTLAYQAGLGGSIMGDSTQTVEHGADATVVAAVPDPGYLFVSWSDGITTTNRTETNVQANLQVTAEFREQLSPPEDVTTGVDSGSLELSWESNPYADSYNIYYALEPGVTPGNFSTLLGGGMLADVSSPVTLNELDGGQRYYFVVTTVIDGVESAVGDEISLLLPNTPWLVSAHQGRLRAELTGSSTATIDWDTAFGESYNLYISKDPEADLSQYASYGVELQLNVSPPVSLSDLVIDEPVYLALEVNGEVSDWTNVISRTWGVNDTVHAQVIGEDGTRYVGGDFTMAGMNTGKIAAFPIGNNATSPHMLSMPQVNGPVHAVSSDGKGGWYIGGGFTKVGSENRLRLAHIDAVGRITGWNPGANDIVRALVVLDDQIYAGGDFTSAGNGNAAIARNMLASFNSDGSLTSWNPYADGAVRAFAIGNNALYVGGDFSGIGGGAAYVSRRGLAKFDLNGDLMPWAVVPGTVNALAYHNGNVYVGGHFILGSPPSSITNGIPYNDYRVNLAAYTSGGALLRDWTPIANGDVTSILIDIYDRVVVGGKGTVGNQYYQAIGGGAYQGVTRYCPSGSFFDPIATNTIRTLYCKGSSPIKAMAKMGASVIAAEEMNTVFGADGQLVDAMASSQGVLFVAGDFDIAAGSGRLRLAAFNSDGFLKNWNPGANSSVKALAINNGAIYAGGNFSLSGGEVATTAREKLAAYDVDGNLLSWNPGVNNQVNVLMASEDVIYAGGYFTTASDSSGSQTRSRLAAFDVSSNLLPWNPGANSYVNALSAADGLIYAGGDFTSVGGGLGNTSKNYIAAFDLAGNVSAWSGETNEEVLAVTVDDGIVYASGKFTAAGGSTGSAMRYGLAAFGVNGNLTSWSPWLIGGRGYSLFAHDGLVYAGGNFTGVDGGAGVTPVNGLAAVTSSGVLTAWQPKTNGLVSSIATDGTSVFVSGEFARASDDTREVGKSRMATFDLNGQLQDR